jgi:hypothetical protein
MTITTISSIMVKPVMRWRVVRLRVFIRYSPKNKIVRNDCAWGSYRRENPRLKGNCKLGMKNASILRFGGLSKLAVLVRQITRNLCPRLAVTRATHGIGEVIRSHPWKGMAVAKMMTCAIQSAGH